MSSVDSTMEAEMKSFVPLDRVQGQNITAVFN